MSSASSSSPATTTSTSSSTAAAVLSPASDLGACCATPGDAQSSSATGQEVVIAGIKAYQVHASKTHVYIMQSDIFGYEFANSRALCEQISKRTGYTTILWDQFNGDPWKKLPFTQEEMKPWRAQHPQSSKTRLLSSIINELVEKHDFTHIYLHGVCYGAKQTVDFGVVSSPSLTGLSPSVLSRVVALVFSHPTFVAPEDPNSIVKPALFNCAEKDEIFKPEARSLFENILSEKKLGTFITYPGVAHGFHTRGIGADAAIQAALATTNTVDFLIKHK